MLEQHRQAALTGWGAGTRYVLQLPRQAQAGHAGALLGKAAGSSLEFMDYRDYQPGDDLRSVDWAAFARTDRLMVRLYRQEVCPHLDLVVDCSASMALEDTDKARATMILAGLLAAAAANAGYTCRLHRLAQQLEPLPSGGRDPRHWQGLDLDYRGNSAEGLLRWAGAFRPRSMRILISDLLWPSHPQAVLMRLSHLGSISVIAAVLANRDVDGPEDGDLQLVDSETGEVQPVLIDRSARRRYRQALGRHQQSWQDACRSLGAVLVSIRAETFCRDMDVSGLLANDVMRVC